MTLTAIASSDYFLSALALHPNDLEVLVNVTTSALPERDLPLISYSNASQQLIHPAHTFVLGRNQAMMLAPYPVSQLDAPELDFCHPCFGDLYVNSVVNQAINHHNELQHACAVNKSASWGRAWKTINSFRNLPPGYPALWTPNIAATLAKPGSVIELIQLANNYHFYSALTDVLVADGRYTVFRADLLGFPRGSMDPSPVHIEISLTSDSPILHRKGPK